MELESPVGTLVYHSWNPTYDTESKPDGTVVTKNLPPLWEIFEVVEENEIPVIDIKNQLRLEFID